MIAKDFFDEVADPVDWLRNLVPLINPGSLIFEEKDFNSFITYICHHQTPLLGVVVAPTIAQRNMMFDNLRRKCPPELISQVRSTLIALEGGTRIIFTYPKELECSDESVVGFRFDAVLIGDPYGTPENI